MSPSTLMVCSRSPYWWRVFSLISVMPPTETSWILLSRGVLDAEGVGAFGNTFEVKGAIAAEVGVYDAFLILRIFDDEMAAVDGMTVSCSRDDTTDGVEFTERDGDVFSAALLACAKFDGDCIADVMACRRSRS